MNVTLFLEICSSIGKLMLVEHEDLVCRYIDITGGFGRRELPLAIHYTNDNERLIGDDAYEFDYGEHAFLIESVRDTDIKHRRDFIVALMTKIENQMPQYKVSKLVIICGPKDYEEKVWDMDILPKPHIVKYKEAVAGYCLRFFKDSKDALPIHYFDGEEDYIYNVFNQDKQIYVEETKARVPLSDIDQYYLDLLYKEHKKHDEKIKRSWIKSLFVKECQRLYRQLAVNKDIKVYSSITYPPIQINLKQKAFNHFRQEWIDAFKLGDLYNVEEQMTDGFIYCGRSEWIQLVKDAFSSFTGHLEEHLMLDGAYAFLELQESEKLSLKISEPLVSKLGITIGVMSGDQFISLLERGSHLKSEYCFDMILTDYEEILDIWIDENNEKKRIRTLPIKHPSHILKIKLFILMNGDREVKEVYYECDEL